MILIPVACIDKQEILKEGTRVNIPGDDITMAGILYGPEDPGKGDPAVIVLHGWLEPEENGAGMVSIVAWHLAREGYVAVALSMRGWPVNFLFPTGSNGQHINNNRPLTNLIYHSVVSHTQLSKICQSA